MGIHYVNGTLPGETQLDASKPQALIYEPVNGKRRLVGAEFIVDAATWLAGNGNTTPLYSMDKSSSSSTLPIVSTSPHSSRFFERHVWARRDNPQGTFVDRNNHVSCELQSIDQIDQMDQ